MTVLGKSGATHLECIRGGKRTKTALNVYFESFIAFFFPHAHRDIDSIDILPSRQDVNEQNL